MPLAKPPQFLRTRVNIRRRPTTPLVRRFSPPSPSTFAGTGGLVGYFRVADPTLEGYELYIGVDGDPDFTASPAESFTSLPHDTAPLAADHEYRLVLRYRNRWDLLSLNTDAIIIDLAPDGSLNPTKPSPADQLRLVSIAGGKVEVTARYIAIPDGVSAADTWLLYLTVDGSTPTPGVTTPIVLEMVLPNGMAYLTYDTAALAEGTLVKALVRTRRTGTPNVDSVSTAVVTATATLIGPAAIDPADAFLTQSSRLTQ